MREGSEKDAYGDLCETVLHGQVKRCVRLVIEIWVSDIGRVVANYALDKRKVVEEDGATEAARDFDPRRNNHGELVGRI